jgi:hypothetical protein
VRKSNLGNDNTTTIDVGPLIHSLLSLRSLHPVQLQDKIPVFRHCLKKAGDHLGIFPHRAAGRDSGLDLFKNGFEIVQIQQGGSNAEKSLSLSVIEILQQVAKDFDFFIHPSLEGAKPDFLGLGEILVHIPMHEKRVECGETIVFFARIFFAFKAVLDAATLKCALDKPALLRPFSAAAGATSRFADMKHGA